VPPCIGKTPYRHQAATSILPCDEQTVRRRTGIGISGCGAQGCLITRSRDRRELGRFYRCFPWSVAANDLCKRRQIFKTYFLHRPVEGNASSRTKILSTQIDGSARRKRLERGNQPHYLRAASMPLPDSQSLTLTHVCPDRISSSTIGYHLQPVCDRAMPALKVSMSNHRRPPLQLRVEPWELLCLAHSTANTSLLAIVYKYNFTNAVALSDVYATHGYL
jgi:hypothetical protein